jgi:hypothetical protein
LKGLANFMAAAPARQRTILRNFKYPKPEGAAQAQYYSRARQTIAAYHRHRRPHEWLEHQAEQLLISAADAPTEAASIKRKSNARAVFDYSKTAWSRKTVDVLPDADLEFTYGTVRVSANPDLTIRVVGRTKLLKFDFAPKAPDEKVIKVMCQGLYQAAVGAQIVTGTADVTYFDVGRAVEYHGARAGSRLISDIEAACENIEAIWPTLKPRAVSPA